MSIKRIAQIEEKLQQESGLDNATRQELLALLKQLKSEMMALNATHRTHAESIAGFVGAAAHEATRSDRHPDLLKLALQGLADSVKDVEVEHPRLVQTVNGICTMLSNLGI